MNERRFSLGRVLATPGLLRWGVVFKMSLRVTIRAIGAR